VTYLAPSRAAVEISNLTGLIAAIEPIHHTFLKLIQANPQAENLPGGIDISPDGKTLRISAGAYHATAHPRVVLCNGSALMEYAFVVPHGDEVIALLQVYLTPTGRIYESPERSPEQLLGDLQQPEVVGKICAAVQLGILHSALYQPRS
jgi:hypothetical protein